MDSRETALTKALKKWNFGAVEQFLLNDSHVYREVDCEVLRELNCKCSFLYTFLEVQEFEILSNYIKPLPHSDDLAN